MKKFVVMFGLQKALPQAERRLLWQNEITVKVR